MSLAVVLAPLSKALAMSLVVERCLEFGKNILERRLFTAAFRAAPPLAGADAAVARLEELADHDELGRRVEQAAGNEQEEAALAAERTAVADALARARDQGERAKLLRRQAALAGEWDERSPPATVLVQPATDPDDGWTERTFVLQLFGFAAGIVLAIVADARAFAPLLQGAGAAIALWQDYLLTGLLIGGGSGPVHVLIRFVTERKQVAREVVEMAETTAAAPTAAAAAPAVITGPASSAGGWTDIPYEGGVDRERLADVHRRPANPNLIVYHHTAMSSASSFDDIVAVIKDRGFLTAYNCVILPDGSIRPFCRWDRYGSHAKNYNARSLGIAFHGNFETDPAVPFSNPDGRMGPAHPGEAQLDAGARVVALWTFLYKIPADFAKSIIPHKKIADKACPGSQFPYDAFQRLVEFYRDQWEHTAVAKERIEAFKLKPFVYA